MAISALMVFCELVGAGKSGKKRIRPTHLWKSRNRAQCGFCQFQRNATVMTPHPVPRWSVNLPLGLLHVRLSFVRSADKICLA